MDRLETFAITIFELSLSSFTFQYGQIRNILVFHLQLLESIIYIPVWIDQKPNRRQSQSYSRTYLHSSMDRLETNISSLKTLPIPAFTFQYGQIRNLILLNLYWGAVLIYIPVWIDQKLYIQYHLLLYYLRIYIPVWIDQKHTLYFTESQVKINLHSSMDRLETQQWTF